MAKYITVIMGARHIFSVMMGTTLMVKPFWSVSMQHGITHLRPAFQTNIFLYAYMYICMCVRIYEQS